MLNINLLICLIVLCFTAIEARPVQAADFNSAKTKGVFYAGIDSGGDTLVTTFFTSGGTGDVEAGSGVYFALGALVPVSDDGAVQAQFTIGLKSDSSGASNGSVDFDRWPLEAIGFYTFKYARIGAGLTYHINPSLKGDGVANNIQADFDNAVGTVLEVGLIFGGSYGLAFKHTDIEYTATGLSGKIDGSSNGIHFIFAF
jgi:hypothetical protein